MAIQRILPGSRLAERDPVCRLKYNEDLINDSYDYKEPRNTEMGRWYEDRIKHELLSHCVEKDPYRPQQDDEVTSKRWPVPDDSPPKPRHGGPIWSTKKNL